MPIISKSIPNNEKVVIRIFNQYFNLIIILKSKRFNDFILFRSPSVIEILKSQIRFH